MPTTIINYVSTSMNLHYCLALLISSIYSTALPVLIYNSSGHTSFMVTLTREPPASPLQWSTKDSCAWRHIYKHECTQIHAHMMQRLGVRWDSTFNQGSWGPGRLTVFLQAGITRSGQADKSRHRPSWQNRAKIYGSGLKTGWHIETSSR